MFLQKLVHCPSKEVEDEEREMNQNENSDFNKHRHEKQLRSIKHEVTKTTNGNAVTKNIADQIICVEKMANTHEFVHIHKQQHPVITLYTDQQITDLKRFCCTDNGFVLGMNKTYNLGEFHVTPTVYKDTSVIKRRTNDHPICFGPTFIHQTSTTKAYSSFLHDIADNLSDTEITNLTIGSDEELACKNAIRRCFNGCTHVLCTRHLKENKSDTLKSL